MAVRGFRPHSVVVQMRRGVNISRDHSRCGCLLHAVPMCVSEVSSVKYGITQTWTTGNTRHDFDAYWCHLVVVIILLVTARLLIGLVSRLLILLLKRMFQ